MIGYEGGLHCDLRVTDLGRALTWYTDVLGFSVIHHVPENGWAELQTPVADVRVGLTEVESMPPGGGGAVLTFNVRDVDAARAYLETRDDVRFDGGTCTIEDLGAAGDALRSGRKRPDAGPEHALTSG
jgi:catechol 2,3-dioxygenase-like lactoylglutathione lyase family enzyme